MSTRTFIGISILLSFSTTHLARGAEALSMQTLGARLAARPTGEDAEALAEDVRAWFGKDRAGKDNVINGANPKIEGLETAWAIEAPDAKTAAVVTSDGKTLPLTRIGDTPIFAGTFSLAHGSAFRWSYVSRRQPRGQKGPG